MGVLQDVLGLAAERFSRFSLGFQIIMGVGFLLFVAVLFNVLSQLLFKNPNEPPVVFHWFPFIGSTVTYGIDPPRFFAETRKKVGSASVS